MSWLDDVTSLLKSPEVLADWLNALRFGVPEATTRPYPLFRR